MPFSFNFFVSLGYSSRPYHHHQFCVILFFQFLHFVPNMFKFWEGGGSIGIEHEGVFSSDQGHASPDCTSFASVFGVLDDNEVKTEFWGLLECNFGGFVFATVIGNDDLMLDISGFEVFLDIGEHEGYSFLFVVGGDNEWDFGFGGFGLVLEVFWEMEFLVLLVGDGDGFVLAVIEILFPVFVGLEEP